MNGESGRLMLSNDTRQLIESFIRSNEKIMKIETDMPKRTYQRLYQFLRYYQRLYNTYRNVEVHLIKGEVYLLKVIEDED